MKKNIITIIVIILILSAMAAAIWLADKLFYKRDGETVVTQDTYSADGISSVSVSLGVGYVELVEKKDSDVFSVSAVGAEDGFYTVSTDGGVLSVTSDELRWYDRELYKTSDSYGITISIPASFDGDIAVTTDAGDVTVTALTATELDIYSDVGDISLSDVTVPVIDVYADVGNISLESIASDSVAVEADVGNVAFSEATSSSSLTFLKLASDVGNVDASLVGSRDDYAISARSDSGHCNVISGGDGIPVELSTDVGNVNVKFGK